jgi:putative salt-induced outer membrane protein
VTVGAERTVMRNVASVTVQLIGHVAGRLSLDVQNNSAPPAGAEATDTTTKASLVYAF